MTDGFVIVGTVADVLILAYLIWSDYRNQKHNKCTVITLCPKCEKESQTDCASGKH